MIEVEFKMFGAFRKYEGHCSSLRLKFEAPVSVAALKGALGEELASRVPGFSDQALIGDSAIADDSRIYAADETVGRSCVLSILPPVCGG